ncbi:MAG: hypothetical protein J0H68_05675 [Sphingobacteriia bacterium]|nr:hypothetical protein [Sphingobacteriia bacterium]
MLKELLNFEKNILLYLNSVNDWNSLLIDYEKPITERLWKNFNNHRVYLHRIYPCNKEEAFFHPHPWPSAIKIVNGTYEMFIGTSDNENRPKFKTKVVLTSGSYYEMLTSNEWHSVRPINNYTYSIMISGKPFIIGETPRQSHLKPLSEEKKKEIFDFFLENYTSSSNL